MSINVTQASLLDAKGAKTALTFEVLVPNPNLGQVLVIYFTDALIQGTKGVQVQIEYSTGANATALNWLTKEQTATKVQPYLFSQCEPIYCRSIAPLQDTPSVKTPYTANITVPKEQKVFMSADSVGNPTPVGTDKMMFQF